MNKATCLRELQRFWVSSAPSAFLPNRRRALSPLVPSTPMCNCVLRFLGSGAPASGGVGQAGAVTPHLRFSATAQPARPGDQQEHDGGGVRRTHPTRHGACVPGAARDWHQPRGGGRRGDGGGQLAPRRGEAATAACVSSSPPQTQHHSTPSSQTRVNSERAGCLPTSVWSKHRISARTA